MIEDEVEVSDAEEKPVLNVVSTVKAHKSSQLKWQIRNFGLFLNSTAASLQQKFGPLTSQKIVFELRLSKRQSIRNDDDKLELALVKLEPLGDDSNDSTAQLKGQIELDGDEGWKSEFVLNFTTNKNHRFATPFSSFNASSTLKIDRMFFEQVVVETDVLSSWVMRLDDSFLMSRSAVDLMKLEEAEKREKQASDSSNADLESVDKNNTLNNMVYQYLVFPEQQRIQCSTSSGFAETNSSTNATAPSIFDQSDAETFENLELASNTTELSNIFDFNAEIGSSLVSGQSTNPHATTPTGTNAKPLTPEALKEIEKYEDYLVSRLPGIKIKEDQYKKEYTNFDDEWLKSLDELMFSLLHHDNYQQLKAYLLSLKEAHRELYTKMREQFNLFNEEAMKEYFLPEKKKFNELHILITYFKAILNKLAEYQESFDEAQSLDSIYEELDDFGDYGQERKWLEQNFSDEQIVFDNTLANEIRSYCQQFRLCEAIQANVQRIWQQFHERPEASWTPMGDKFVWCKWFEEHIIGLQQRIGEAEIECAKLLIRPIDVEEFGKLRCKLAQLMAQVEKTMGAPLLMYNEKEEEEKKKQSEEENLQELRRMLRDLQLHFMLYPEFSTNNPANQRFITETKQTLEKAKERIKKLDRNVSNPMDCVQLDNIKDVYDQLFEKLTRFEEAAKQNAKLVLFNKNADAIRQLHSSLSYTMHGSDSETLINYEVELCKCSAELEQSYQSLAENNQQSDQVKVQYVNAKVTIDWIANQLRERLEPWRQFMDLYSSIEKSHKAVGELISQLSSKTDNGPEETQKDIEVLESVNVAFEETRKDIAFIRRLCSAGQMKSAGLASEAVSYLNKVNNAHIQVENGINVLLLKLKSRNIVNHISGRHRHRRGHHHRRNGGSYHDSFY